MGEYKDLSKNKQQLSECLDYLSKNEPNEKASREDIISFYINLYNASTLETQLEQVTTDFIRSSENKIQSTKVQLSKIFEWYKSDFENDEGSLMDFLNKYSNVRNQG